MSACPVGLRDFDDQAPTYEDWFKTPLGSLVHRRETGLILRLLKPEPHTKILELGTGTGHFLREVASRGSWCVGLDPSEAMLNAARSRPSPSGLQYMRGRGESLPFRDEAFDGLFCMTVLEFVDNIQDIIREAARVVRPSGLLFFGVLNADSRWAAQRKRRGGLWAGARFFRESELRTLLAPFGALRVEYCVHAGPQAGKLPAPLLLLVDSVLARLSPASGALIGVQVTKRRT